MSNRLKPLRNVRRAALAITFLTGITGLIYEVTWHRYLSNFLGSQAQAAAIILAVFLGGLCVGYVLFGRYSRNHTPSQNIALCGWLEMVIGIWAICFPSFYHLVWAQAGILSTSTTLSLLLDVGICIVLIGVPTICMGCTLPLLTQGLSRDLDDAAPFHAKVYAINTGGAFLGCLAGGFVLIPALGLSTTMLYTATINIAAGLALVFTSRFVSNEESALSKGHETLPDPFSESIPLGRAIVVSFLAGGYALSFQTIFMRLVGQSIGSSEYAFSMIVAVFILMLALGAWVIANRSEEVLPVWKNQLLALVGTIFVYCTVPYWPYAAHVIRTLLTNASPNFYLYHGLVFFSLLLLLAIPVGAMGATLPLLFGATRSKFGELGENVGKLYGWNTLGCVAGALSGGYLLLYIIDLDTIFRLSVTGIAASLLLVYPWKQKYASLSRIAVITVMVLTVFAGELLPRWDKRRFAVGLFRYRQALPNTYTGPSALYSRLWTNRALVRYEDGPNTSVAIIEGYPDSGRFRGSKQHKWRALYVNGKSDSATFGVDRQTLLLLGHLPALFSQTESNKAAVIGYGTGLSLAALNRHPQYEQLHSIEIAPTVKDVAPYFDFANSEMSKNSKLHWIIGDAYRALGTSSSRYDTIVSQPSNPWVTGVEKLYSQEFFEIAKNTLAPGGIYAQWFHTYSVSPHTLELVFGTFASVFPQVRVFQVQDDLLLLGSERAISLKALEKSYSNESISSDLKANGISSIDYLLGKEVWLPIKMYLGGPVHTLERPLLAFRAGRDFFFGGNTDIDQLTASPYAKIWSNEQAARTLISERLAVGKSPKTTLREYAKSACGSSEAIFFKGWRSSSHRCQVALVALAAHGAADASGYLSKQELGWLAVLRKSSKINSIANNVPEAVSAIRLFAKYRSALLNLSAKRLESFAKPCFRKLNSETFDCRMQLIEALVMHRSAERANTLFNDIAAQGGDKIPEALSQQIQALINEGLAARRSEPPIVD